MENPMSAEKISDRLTQVGIPHEVPGPSWIYLPVGVGISVYPEGRAAVIGCPLRSTVEEIVDDVIEQARK